MTEARVHYKVCGNELFQDWYPPGRWDWLFGAGYNWTGIDHKWFPGWSGWGRSAPRPGWWRRTPLPPELVAESEVEIGPDGTVKVEIDTDPAMEAHPDQDHRYTIIAEVTDLSRRTIVGQGEVLVARRPFELSVWLDRGYYRQGDVIRANFDARRIDDKPVEGEGHVTLYSLRYENDKPIETPVADWDLSTDAAGKAALQLTASKAGQYRLSYKLKDSNRQFDRRGDTVQCGRSRVRRQSVSVQPARIDSRPERILAR